MTVQDGLLRHVRACANATLPGGRAPFRLGGEAVGYVRPDVAAAVLGWPGVRRDGEAIMLDDPAALPALVRALADTGLCRWRAEPFDVRGRRGGPVLATVDRGALPVLGIRAEGVHVNGLVERADGAWLWVARRAADRPLDPGKLDHMTAGGIGAGQTPFETLLREADEEAGIPPDLARLARPIGAVAYACERAEGLRRDYLHCYDLVVPAEFTPRPADGEAAGFELWPVDRVDARLRDSDDFKFNVALVLIDLMIRRGLIVGNEATALSRAMAMAAAMAD